ncbi:MAG: hypothetical protein ACLTDR_05790 [Adlercreutzia equolifaciens]
MFDTVASQVSALSFVDIFNFCVFLTFTICYTLPARSTCSWC